MNLLFFPFLINLILASVIWLLAFWDAKSKKIWQGKLPKISFIIPAYNSQDFINQTIDSLFSQKYPKNKTEIIVYASGDLNNYNFKKYQNKNFRFIKSKNKVEKALAVNRAFKKTKHDFIFIVDSDTILKQDVLKKIILRFNDKKVGAVTASRTAKFSGFWSLLQGFEYIMTNILLASYNKLGSTIGLNGCAMCFRKQAFEKARGLRRVPAQDIDIALRLANKNWKIICEIQAISITLAPSFLKWFGQRLRWMRGFFLAIANNYQIFYKKPFGIFFLIIYSLIGLVYIANFILAQGFLKSAIGLILILIAFRFPVLIAFILFFGFFGWTIYNRIILLILYSCLSLPYIVYPYKIKSFLKTPLIFAYSIIYLPLFGLTGIIGIILAIKDKIQNKKIIKW